MVWILFLFQAEDGIRYLVRSRGLGDVYKRQVQQLGPGNPRKEILVAAAEAHHFVRKHGPHDQRLSLIHI